MYINDTHIMYYAVVAILGLFVGMFVDWMNSRLPEDKKVFTKEIKEYFIKFKPNYILMLITSATYVALLYNYGIKNTFIANLDLIKFMILTPMLLSAFVIDYKLQIIPNRLNLTMFEAILSIVLLATKIKKMDEYIPFGPFIVLGTFISIFVPFQVIKSILMQIFTLGLYKG